MRRHIGTTLGRVGLAQIGLACFCFVAASGSASAQTVYITNDRVGVGVETPTARLHVQRSDGTAQLLVEETNPSAALRTLFRMVNTGPVNTQYETPGAVWRQQFQDNAYALSKDGTGGNEVTIVASSGDMTVRGALTAGGLITASGFECAPNPCDEVLAPDFPLESIEEHEEAMLAAGYLLAVGRTRPREPVDIPQKVGGMLNELEKAHLYIGQLNRRLTLQQEELDRLRVANRELGALAARLESLERVLGGRAAAP